MVLPVQVIHFVKMYTENKHELSIFDISIISKIGRVVVAVYFYGTI